MIVIYDTLCSCQEHWWWFVPESEKRVDLPVPFCIYGGQTDPWSGTCLVWGSLRGIHDIPVQIQVICVGLVLAESVCTIHDLLYVSGMVFKASRWWRLHKGTCYGACFCFCFFFLPRLPSSCSLQLKSMAQSKATCRTGSCNSITPEMHCAHLDQPHSCKHRHHCHTTQSHSLTSFSASWSQAFYLFVRGPFAQIFNENEPSR